ncbi:MAG TPA: tetratricopeptide repeat protein [Longimicrobium sp.]|jgi:tetratricopeptide (TPR) repeat protein|uniref:tetratricopeptide repeat protein n=1 Tax=Longimicrobium sp. TaxID=2029185 RepID=UPI002ED9A84C
MPHPAGRPARRSRPSYLAAPPLLSESEPFEGAALLREHPGALGAVLWKSLRDVSAWTAAAPDERAALFPPAAAGQRAAEVAGAGAETELWGPLLVVERLLAQPVDVDYRRLVHACRAIARWGERRGFTAVQLAFVQAAARLVPDHPQLAYSVGRLARDRGEYARAESWLRCAIRLARGTDWHTYALAYLSLGTLYQQLGNLPAARAVTLRGYRTTVRRRVRALQGVALHNLFAICSEMLDFGRAQQYALAAFQEYGPEHPRLPMLVHDVGCVWILQGRFAPAKDAFQMVLPRFSQPEDRLLTLGTLARAAAAAGSLAAYESSYAEAVQLLHQNVATPERASQVWLNLARAAASAGEYERAVPAAQQALALAGTLRLGQIRMEVESLLHSVNAARAAGQARLQAAPPVPVDPQTEQDAAAFLDAVRATVA